MEYQGLCGVVDKEVVTSGNLGCSRGWAEVVEKFSLLLSPGAIQWRHFFDEHALDVAPGSAQKEGRGLAGDASDVWSKEDAARGITFETKERTTGPGGLLGVNVDCRATQMAGLERIREGRFVHDAAAGGLNQDGSWFRGCELALAEKPFGGRQQGHRQGDDVSPSSQFGEGDGFRAERFSHMRISRSGIPVAELAASLLKRFSHSQTDHTESHDANDQAIEAEEIVRNHARPKFAVVAGADLGVGPCEATQKNGCGRDHIFRHGSVAPAGDIGCGNAEAL